MFYVFEDLSFNNNLVYNVERINGYLATLARRLNEYDFYIYDEGWYNINLLEHSNYNGEVLYPPAIKPTKINWYVSENILCYSDLDNSDICPIATLRFVLEQILSEFNLEINGSVMLFCYNSEEVIYYKINNSQIYKHINKTMYLSKYLRYANQLADGGAEINDPEFKAVLNEAFTIEPYMFILNEYGVEYFIEILAGYI